ncbi:hypothetical protein PR003_g21746 [Phytophthora rubi]|uniref:Uncharacterized protein n=1 Tax=Phytophthora rubi TaxID=129364 RepID=A0A6A3LRP5_9STRA|nr:hypothetical protein PR001_g13501 [Phytophthora rubi]KAE9304441.1 hypothetical protein PR003_g21746 [Phytophthora rubi]
MRRNVLVAVGPRHELPSDVIIAALSQNLAESVEVSGDVQKGTLGAPDLRLGGSTGQKNRRPKKGTSAHSPNRQGGWGDLFLLKGPMMPKDRLRNRYMINFIDNKSNYGRVFLTVKLIDVRIKFLGALAKRGVVPREQEDASRSSYQGARAAENGDLLVIVGLH